MKFYFLPLLLGIATAVFSQTKDHQPVPGSKVSLVPPKDFIASAIFNGFQREEAGASVIVTELPGPIKEVTKGFTEAGLKERGMTLLEEKPVDIVSGKASLYKIKQLGADKTVFYKYVLVFGDDKKTILINGTYPERSAALDASIKTSLLTASYNDNQDVNDLATAKFSLDVQGTILQFTKFISGSLIYTSDGLIPTKAADKLVFVGSASQSRTAIADKKQFALDRLKQLPGGEAYVAKETKAIIIDSLQGFEITADGVDATGKKQQVYQVLLYPESGGYYILLGTATSTTASHLDLFKKTAKTFRQKK